jgi:hypothetical protein
MLRAVTLCSVLQLTTQEEPSSRKKFKEVEEMVNTKCLFKASFILQLYLSRVEAGPSLRRGQNRRERTEKEQINRQAAGNDEDDFFTFWETVIESSMSFTAYPSGQPSKSSSFYSSTAAPIPAPTPTSSGSQPEEEEFSTFWETVIENSMSFTASPSVSSKPSTVPTAVPSHVPTPTSSGSPSESPSSSTSPSLKPSTAPTAAPSPVPTPISSGSPSEILSHHPSEIPSQHPSGSPSESPTSKPSEQPTVPSEIPSQHPSGSPSKSGSPSGSPTTWSTILSYQNEVGVCNGLLTGVGCADNAGVGERGNPNDIVNCFNVTEFGAFIPFFVESVRFFTSESLSLSPDLKIRVWDGTTTGGPIGDPLLTQEIFGFVVGENNFALDEPFEIGTEQICIGLFSETPTAGLRIRGEDGTGLQSYLKAPVCGAQDFVTTASVGAALDLCIEASLFG